MAQLTPTWFTPETEKKKTKPQKFRIRPLNSVEMWEVNTHMRVNANNGLAISFEGQKLSLSVGLLDWDIGSDDKGEKIPCDESNWTDVDPYTLALVANQIRLISEVTEDERKN